MAGIPNNPLKRRLQMRPEGPRPLKRNNTGQDHAPMAGIVFGPLEAAIANPMVFPHPGGAGPAA